MIPEPQRTYLLELLTALGPAAHGLTLVGGHALRFMIARPRSTRDFDFVLDVAYLRGCDTSLASVLASLGYSVDENARNFQFEKPIPNSPEVMRIEFMAPAEFVRKGEIRVDVQSGVHGRACVGGSIVVVETDKHEVVGSLPDGKPARAEVQVTRAHAFVLLKLLALDDRYRNVRGPTHAEHNREEARTHAGDIVAVLSAQTNLGEFRKRFGSQFGPGTALKGGTYQIIRDYFGDETRPGLVLYGESLIASLPSGETVRDLGSELLRAQRFVSSLLLE
ncbi:MAG: nucleotidyl transferase AbiEii/AbiGii toxin family protein [Terriglobia bacterium]|jgi:hypothetical protein